MNLKKYFVGMSAMLIMFANNPQVSADDVEIFGSEFEPETTQPAENPTVEEIQTEEPIQIESTNSVEEQPVENPAVEEIQIEEPVQSESLNSAEEQPVENPVVEEIQTEESIQTEPLNSAEEQPVENPVVEEIQTEEPIQTEPLNFEEEQSKTEEVTQPFSDNTNGNDEEEFGDELNFNDWNNSSESVEVFQMENSSKNDNRNNNVTIIEPKENNSSQKAEKTSNSSRKSTAENKNLKLLPQRFVKIALDENYIYYLDKQSVTWKKIPYMSSEYMADVWIRMIERNPYSSDISEDMASYIYDTNTDEITYARSQGLQYKQEDIDVLKRKKYFLEHYYLRPKKDQIQFLCELEVVGHPQNTASQRKYDAANWEELIPGSMESIMYYSIIQIIGRSKASDRGHMNFADMVEEYARISIR